ncbi:multisubunit sodium/proton antiporter, MrpG subunit [Rubritalea squalenifaciens DSM 18772]|uniref:Multisubunit sodium/proton antiporter, MrpG subunit n=2 Tax=Rubritalea TaxID=361050 RepID=A0A1M6DR47_9BACT|nr:monovalent cation/H(+) antiporter subunit G [Rubritalea squalenifaciens]SHI75609.1 multisubunit sodium/proton antiporter, MrpG subunit [Rubritalea squalenifaciens DSM 18772]
MTTIIVSTILILGSLFGLLASIGVMRMPDLFCRMHAATKAGAFGLGTMLLAFIIANPNPRSLIQSSLIIIFFYLTAPVAAQMIGRAGIRRRVHLFKGTKGVNTQKNENIQQDSQYP